MEELSNTIIEKLERESISKARFDEKALNTYLKTYPNFDFKNFIIIQLLKSYYYNPNLFLYLIEFWQELEIEDIKDIISKVNNGDLLIPLVRFFTSNMDINLLILIKKSNLHVNEKLYIFYDYDYAYFGVREDEILQEHSKSLGIEFSTFVSVKKTLQIKYHLTPLDKQYIKNTIATLRKEKLKKDGIILHYKNELNYTIIKLRAYYLNLIRRLRR